MTQRMIDALNDQIKWEFYSSYLYLSMSAYFSDLGMSGFANWMWTQSREEVYHGMKFFKFVNERGGRVKLMPIDQPTHTWESPLHVFEDALAHERVVTQRINDLANLAIEDKDHATNIFLQWFITEQVEEEDSFNELLGKLKLIDGRGEGLFMIDKDLGARVYTPSTTEVLGGFE